MKTHKLIIAAIVIAAALFAHACVGGKAREGTLLPALRTAWPGVQSDIELGIEVEPSPGADTAQALVHELDLALDEGDPVRISATPWAVLRPYGERGIDERVERGEIARSVAPSLLERLKNFGDALGKMRSTP